MTQQSGSKRQSHRYRPGLADPVRRCRCAHRAHAGVVITDLLFAVDDDRTVQLDYVGVVVAKLIPCTVTADDYVFWHT